MVEHEEFSPVRVRLRVPCNEGNGTLVIFVHYYSVVDMDYSTSSIHDFDRPSENANSVYATSIHANPDNYLYGHLTDLLVGRGYSVIGYNALGLGCGIGEIPHRLNPYCIRSQEVSNIRLRDFSLLLNSIMNLLDQHIAPSQSRRVIFVGHSGASLAVSGLVKEWLLRGRSVSGLGFVGISAAIGPGVEALKHQLVDYWISRLGACRSTFFGRCSKRILENRALVERVPLNLRKEMSSLLLRDGRNAIPKVKHLLASHLSNFLLATQRFGDSNESWIGTRSSSSQFSPNTNVLKGILLGLSPLGDGIPQLGASRLVYGDSDLALSADMQWNAWLRHGGKASDIILLPGLGHALGLDPLHGPPSKEGIAAVIAAVDEVSGRIFFERIESESSFSPPR